MFKNTLFLKRMALALSVVSTAMLLSSCGKTPIEKAQDKIVSIGKQFLDYELTADEAHKQLESVVIPQAEENGDIFLRSDKGTLELLILQSKITGNTYEEIEDKIKYIKSQDYR